MLDIQCSVDTGWRNKIVPTSEKISELIIVMKDRKQFYLVWRNLDCRNEHYSRIVVHPTCSILGLGIFWNLFFTSRRPPTQASSHVLTECDLPEKWELVSASFLASQGSVHFFKTKPSDGIFPWLIFSSSLLGNFMRSRFYELKILYFLCKAHTKA